MAAVQQIHQPTLKLINQPSGLTLIWLVQLFNEPLEQLGIGQSINQPSSQLVDVYIVCLDNDEYTGIYQ